MRRTAEPLVLVGSGGFGRETAQVIRTINDDHMTRTGRPRWDLLGFVDDDMSRWGTTVSGTPVIGAVDKLRDLPEARVVLCTGNPRNFGTKRQIVRRLGLPAGRYATLVHPQASIAPSCRIGEGSVVLAGAVATADVTIGAHVGLMPQVVLTHDNRLGDFVTAGAGVRLAGAVEVETGAYLGSGCLVREGLRIGAWSLIGMGAVVLRSVPAGQVWAGVPAQFVRSVELPHEVMSA